MEFVNAIYQFGADEEIFSNLIIMLSPIAPHFAEELWQGLGNTESISGVTWPRYDPKMLVEEIVTIVIQVNGKVRSKIDVPADIPEDKLKELVLADEKLQPWLQGKAVKNFIIVPKKLVNLVI
jgi:leucyl-tRNA synthetase